MNVLLQAQAHWEGHMWGWSGDWMWIWMLLFWAALVALAVGLFHRTDPGRRDDRDPAREILAKRYARGEIDTDEYEERLAALR